MAVIDQRNFEEAAYELPEIWQDGWFSEEDRNRVRELSALIPVDAKTLMDVGCGNGLFLNWLRESGAGRFDRLVGLDRSEAALSHVRTTKGRARVDALPFGDGAFDVVTCMEVLEHLAVGVFPRAVDELSRVAKKYLLVSVPFRQDLDASLSTCPSCRARFNADFHVRSFDEATMGALFEGHGFRPVKSRRLGESVTYVDQAIRSRVHAWFRSRPGLPAYAVCPVCGFHDGDGLRRELAARATSGLSDRAGASPAPGRAEGRRGWVSRFRPRLTTHRWICTLYAR